MKEPTDMRNVVSWPAAECEGCGLVENKHRGLPVGCPVLTGDQTLGKALFLSVSEKYL